MNPGRPIFAQLMEYLPLAEFRKAVNRYKGDHRVRHFSSLDQFYCMAFAQLTYRESLRDIETCLRAMQSKLYHMGIRGKVSRSTLADANEKRNWKIYADFAQVLIRQAQVLYANETLGFELSQAAYALDSTVIDLCLSLFPWAKFRKTRGGVKLHVLLDLKTHIPVFACITNAFIHDIHILDTLFFEAGAFYIMDRAYLDFSRLYRLHQSLAFFVTREKKNFNFIRRYSHVVDHTTGVLFDQTVLSAGFYAKMDYPEPLRRIGYRDPETNKRLVFLTNNFALSALTIARLYKQRWQVELFFKWIKQHLRIKAFYGASENAVKSQIWIAISVYVLVAIVKKKMNLNFSLYTILQILSLSLFEKMPIKQAFLDFQTALSDFDAQKQLSLFKN